MHDDPRLTAYALGELDEAERAAVEGWLDEDPELALELAAIDDVADLLGEAFAREAQLRPETAPPRPASSAWWTIAAAAAVLLAIGAGIGLPDASRPGREGRSELAKTAPLHPAPIPEDLAASPDELGPIMAERDVPGDMIQCASPPDETGLAQDLPALTDEGIYDAFSVE